jgi:hypothetical protein
MSKPHLSQELGGTAMKRARLLTGAAGVLPFALAATAAAAAPAAAATAPAHIEKGTCSAATKTWLDLYTTYHGQVCYGFSGTINPDMYAGTYCPGNNWGVLYYTGPGAKPSPDFFFPGQGWHAVGKSIKDYVSGLHISHWSGNDTC